MAGLADQCGRPVDELFEPGASADRLGGELGVGLSW